MEARQELSPYNVISPSPVKHEEIPYQPLPLVPERPAVTPSSVSPSSVTPWSTHDKEPQSVTLSPALSPTSTNPSCIHLPTTPGRLQHSEAPFAVDESTLWFTKMPSSAQGVWARDWKMGLNFQHPLTIGYCKLGVLWCDCYVTCNMLCNMYLLYSLLLQICWSFCTRINYTKLDISSTFDKVLHNKLMFKIKKLRITSNVHNLIKIKLTYQYKINCVVMNGSASD